MTITLGTFLTDLQSSTTSFMSDLAPVTTLIIGILLAFWLLSFVVDLLQKNEETETIAK
jgi:hypothetical protein